MPKLFEDEVYESDTEIKTNNDYATAYNQWRQKEELNKLKTKYGDPLLTAEDLSDDDSSSSEDDEEGRELDQEFEKNFFKTLSHLKNKDPKIYDDKVVFFKEKPKENDEGEKKKKVKKAEPMFLKDYERKMILEKGAKFEDSDEDEEEDEDPRARSPTYVEEQRKLKESLKQALNDDEKEDEDWGGMFKKRQKTKEEEDKDEGDYKQWLKGKKEELNNKDEETELMPLKEYWSDPKLDSTETFLRDYLLNKRYLEKDNEDHIPTYEEIIHDSDESLSADEDAISRQEEFEHKYNFRYEEPDQEFIKRYPRTMEHSVRKTDDRRKVKRAEIKERKEQEKKQKQEDLKQLKALKRQEIAEKIKKLKEITGNEEMAFQDVDLDGDFDPEAHDKRMQELFNDNYYQGEEGDQKPEFSDFEEELGPWRDDNELHCEDDDFNMDCDYDPNTAKKQKEKKGKKKRNRPGKESKDEDELPVDKNDERYEEYMDELYKIDCEDMIGDIPCRFKYREVVPNDFGLSVEEILLAKDKELNRWCSLKKATQYRPEHIERYEVIAYQRKSKNENAKKKILPSLYSEETDKLLSEQEAKVKLSSKEENNSFVEEENDETNAQEEEWENNEITNEEENVCEENLQDDEHQMIVDEKIQENNVQKTKSKKKNKKLKMNEENKDDEHVHKDDNFSTETVNTNEDTVSPKNKKKKQKHSESNENNLKVENKATDENTPNKPLSRRQKKNKKIKQLAPQSETKTNNNQKEVKKNKKRKHSETNEQPSKKQKVNKNNQETADDSIGTTNKKQKFNKNNKSNKNKESGEIALSKSRLEAYGINPKKFNNKLKYKNKNK